MTVIRIAADVKLVRLYKCFDCGAQARGSTERFSFDERCAGDAAAKIIASQPSPSAMPVDWASYGCTVYRCPECKK